MGAGLHDAAVAHGRDEVGVANGGEAVCHHEARAALHEARERRLHLDLGARVDVARGLVEDEHGSVREHGARDAEELTLAG